MNCISMDSIIEVFYHLNKMLIHVATKHIADNNLPAYSKYSAANLKYTTIGGAT